MFCLGDRNYPSFDLCSAASNFIYGSQEDVQTICCLLMQSKEGTLTLVPKDPEQGTNDIDSERELLGIKLKKMLGQGTFGEVSSVCKWR